MAIELNKKQYGCSREDVHDSFAAAGIPVLLWKYCARYTTHGGPEISRAAMKEIYPALRSLHADLSNEDSDKYIDCDEERRKEEYKYVCVELLKRGYKHYAKEYVPLPILFEYIIKNKNNKPILAGDLLMSRLETEAKAEGISFEKYKQNWCDVHLEQIGFSDYKKC